MRDKHPGLGCNNPQVHRAASLARRLFPGLRDLIGDNPRLMREVAWTLQRLSLDQDQDDRTIEDFFRESEEEEARVASLPGRDRPIGRSHRDSEKARRLARRLVARLDDGSLREFALEIWRSAYLDRRETVLWWTPGRPGELIQSIPPKARH